MARLSLEGEAKPTAFFAFFLPPFAGDWRLGVAAALLLLVLPMLSLLALAEPALPPLDSRLLSPPSVNLAGAGLFVSI